MGLDWMLNKSKPKPGQEAVFEQLMLKWHSTDEGSPERDALAAAVKDVAISAYEEIGCPCIGESEKADAWFREMYDRIQTSIREGRVPNPEYRAFWTRPFEQCFEEHKGMPVFDLAIEKGGFGKIQGLMTSPIDFRGKVVAHHLRHAGFLELSNQAFKDHTAPQALNYAKELRLVLLTEKIRGDKADDIDAAVSWLEFWASRGFGFTAWY